MAKKKNKQNQKQGQEQQQKQNNELAAEIRQLNSSNEKLAEQIKIFGKSKSSKEKPFLQRKSLELTKIINGTKESNELIELLISKAELLDNNSKKTLKAILDSKKIDADSLEALRGLGAMVLKAEKNAQEQKKLREANESVLEELRDISSGNKKTNQLLETSNNFLEKLKGNLKFLADTDRNLLKNLLEKTDKTSDDIDKIVELSTKAEQLNVKQLDEKKSKEELKVAEDDLLSDLYKNNVLAGLLGSVVIGAKRKYSEKKEQNEIEEENKRSLAASFEKIKSPTPEPTPEVNVEAKAPESPEVTTESKTPDKVTTEPTVENEPETFPQPVAATGFAGAEAEPTPGVNLIVGELKTIDEHLLKIYDTLTKAFKESKELQETRERKEQERASELKESMLEKLNATPEASTTPIAIPEEGKNKLEEDDKEGGGTSLLDMLDFSGSRRGRRRKKPGRATGRLSGSGKLGRLGRFLGIGGALGAETAGKAAETAAPAVSKIAETAGKAAETAAPAVSKIAETAGKAAETAAPAASKASKFLSKIGGKALVKKIPFIGLAAGLGFAANRAMKGDYLGAAMEAGSGILGTVPGIGTGASLAVDAALAAKDLKDMNKPSDGGEEKEEKKEKLAKEFADKMGIQYESVKFVGNIPIEINGKPVPENLYTEEQKKSIKNARQLNRQLNGTQPESVNTPTPAATATTGQGTPTATTGQGTLTATTGTLTATTGTLTATPGTPTRVYSNKEENEEEKEKLATEFADKMGIQLESARFEGNIPTEINGKPVPENLYTEQQKNSIKNVRKLVRRLNGMQPESVNTPTPTAAPDQVTPPINNGANLVNKSSENNAANKQTGSTVVNNISNVTNNNSSVGSNSSGNGHKGVMPIRSDLSSYVRAIQNDFIFV